MSRLGLSIVSLMFLSMALVAPAAADAIDDIETKVDAVEECADTINSCGGGDVAKAWTKMREACKALRECKGRCSGDRAACQAAGRSAKRDCKAECKGNKNCEKDCREERRKDRRECRKARKACMKDCRAEFKDAGCKDARKDFWQAVGKAAKSCSGVVEEGCSDVFKD